MQPQGGCKPCVRILMSTVATDDFLLLKRICPFPAGCMC